MTPHLQVCMSLDSNGIYGKFYIHHMWLFLSVSLMYRCVSAFLSRHVSFWHSFCQKGMWESYQEYICHYAFHFLTSAQPKLNRCVHFIISEKKKLLLGVHHLQKNLTLKGLLGIIKWQHFLIELNETIWEKWPLNIEYSLYKQSKLWRSVEFVWKAYLHCSIHIMYTCQLSRFVQETLGFQPILLIVWRRPQISRKNCPNPATKKT